MVKNNNYFWYNIENRIIDATIFYVNGKTSKSTKTKSTYYRAMYLLVSTIIEGLLYAIIEEYLHKNNEYIKEVKEYKHTHKIPESLSNLSNKDLVLCILECKKVDIGKETTFDEMINFACKKNIITKQKKIKFHNIRKKRNRLHLQSLIQEDKGYTLRECESVMDEVGNLLKTI